MKEPKVAFCCIVRTDDGIFLRLQPAFLVGEKTVIPDAIILDYLEDVVRDNDNARKIPDNKVAELRLIVVGENDEEFTQVLDPLTFWPITCEDTYEKLYKKYRGRIYSEDI